MRCSRSRDRVAQSDVTVLLTGESGTGKEVLARFIHVRSKRSAGPFVAVNCAAIPEQMLEALLFGYEKGSFTGAQARSVGKFVQANGGTLLLDEITEMDLALQAKLLRVLQEREVEPLGASKPVTLDVRVIATSNRDLKQVVRDGTFREDLYYRLSVFPLKIPPLRERPGDVAALAQRFIDSRSKRPRLLAPEALARLADARLARQRPRARERHAAGAAALGRRAANRAAPSGLERRAGSRDGGRRAAEQRSRGRALGGGDAPHHHGAQRPSAACASRRPSSSASAIARCATSCSKMRAAGVRVPGDRVLSRGVHAMSGVEMTRLLAEMQRLALDRRVTAGDGDGRHRRLCRPVAVVDRRREPCAEHRVATWPRRSSEATSPSRCPKS